MKYLLVDPVLCNVFCSLVKLLVCSFDFFIREEALMLSPMYSVDQMEFNSTCKIMSLIGQYESPEFHRQSKEFTQVRDSNLLFYLALYNEACRNSEKLTVMYKDKMSKQCIVFYGV